MTLFRAGATYDRISKDITGEEDGVTRQAEDGTALARARSIPVAPAHRFADNDISATHGKHRPDYERLMDAVRAGAIDVIIVYAFGRLWRNRRERAEGIEVLRTHGVSVLCVKGPELDLTTAAGRLLAGLLGEVDSFEVEQMAEREQRKMRQSVERGAIPTGPRCFGYTAAGDEVVEREAAEVRAAFDALDAGASVSGIARDLNARGVLNRNGRAWSHNSVRGMLLNERYAALREYRGEIYPGSWPALVDEAIWRKVRLTLGEESRRTSPGPARRWLLSGLALCGVCNDGTTCTTGTRRTKAMASSERTYRCRRIKHVARLAPPIDEYVEWHVIERLARPDAADLLIDDDRPDAAELQRKAAALRARLDGLSAEFADDDDADPREFRAAAKRLRERLAAVEADMTHPDRTAVLADLIAAAADAADPTAAVAAAWEDLLLDRRRAVVNTLMTVTILQGNRGRPKGSTQNATYFDPASVLIVPRGVRQVT